RDLRLALLGRQVGEAIEELAQLLEVSRRTFRAADRELVHSPSTSGGRASRNLWSSHARAKAQSRFAVRGEQPRSSETSSILRPPKKRSSMSRESRGSSAASRSSARSRSI